MNIFEDVEHKRVRSFFYDYVAPALDHLLWIACLALAIYRTCHWFI